jgi:hypothetical protein
MPAAAVHGLRDDVVRKLNQLETGAAVLERDARNRHAMLVERGFAFPLRPSRLSQFQALQARCLTQFERARQAAMRPVRWLVAQSPHILTGLRVARRCVVEGATCVAFAAATLIPLAAVIIMIAPPD